MRGVHHSPLSVVMPGLRRESVKGERRIHRPPPSYHFVAVDAATTGSSTAEAPDGPCSTVTVAF